MKKSLLVTASAVVLTVPFVALATFTRPSEVLTFLSDTGGHPRDFDAKMYLRATADDGTPVQILGTIRGSSEGTSPQDAKLSMHADISANVPDGTMATGFDLMANRQKLYGRISRITMKGESLDADDVSMLHEINAEYANKWYVLDASPQASVSGNFWQDLAESNDLPLAPEELRAIVNQMLDAVFDLQIERYRSGHAYILSQKPHAVTEAVRVLAQAFARVEKNNADLLPLIQDEIESMDLVSDPDIQDMEEEINRTLKIRTKVDISNEGTFQFARVYMTFALPEENDMFFSLEASMQGRQLPVYLDIPEKSEPLENLFGDVLPFLNMPQDTPPVIDDWWTPAQPSSDTDWRKPVRARQSYQGFPLNLPVPSAICSPDGSVRGVDLELQIPCAGGRESRRSLRERVEE